MDYSQQTVKVIFSSLLHDIGKLSFRAGAEGTHSESGYLALKEIVHDTEILDAVRYHHVPELRESSLCPHSAAYIVCAADQIASAAEQGAESCAEESQTSRKDMPMASVFSHMNGNTCRYGVPVHTLHEQYAVPQLFDTLRISPKAYQNILHSLLGALRGVSIQPQNQNTALALLEEFTSCIPASVNSEDHADISFFDHAKITAAVASCISEYLLAQRETDYKNRLFAQKQAFWNEPVFLLYSADFSGIQNFIYTIASAKALKALRSRSFFLELTMEHYIDEILEHCGLSRANLLYSGGGHCYLLLPDTQNTRMVLEQCKKSMNTWIRRNFGTRLYLADGVAGCTANELTNTPRNSYQEIFARVSRRISVNKMRRYSADDLRELNGEQALSNGRECKICGMTSRLTGKGEDCRCKWCAMFEELSAEIQDKDIFVVSRGGTEHGGIELPSMDGTVSLALTDETAARKRWETRTDIIRIYTKNRLNVHFPRSIKLYIGDYYATNQMDRMAKKATGIARNAVCRMDVDNLGMAFAAGFEQKTADLRQRDRYVSLSRTAAFSRQMSLFFKYYMNAILDGLAVSIVYSGGDDVFLVGAWDAVLQAAQRIRSAFAEFTCGTLTLSAGILMHNVKYPIRRAAAESERLEEFSKMHPEKNAVTLFQAAEDCCYSWNTFTEKVMGEKLRLLEKFFQAQKTQEDGRGQAFLYRLLELLRGSKEQINLARFAYLLARMEPRKESEARQVYTAFSKILYQWYLQPEDRKQLITAITIYVYLTRTGGER